MADKGPGAAGRSQKKRLARAKIKPNDNGIKSSKGHQAQQERDALTKAQEKKARKQRLTAIGVGIFAVIMALSMMLPSLSYIFGNSEEQQAAQQQQEEAQKAAEQADSEEDADEGEEESTQTGVALVDSNYAAVVDPLKAKLKESPEDLATLLNLGNDYMAWANEASMYASEDADVQHVTDLYNQAISYFDQYLKLNDSSAVKTNRALCQLYSGDTDGASSALQKLVEEVPDYGPAWANLGMIYEYQGDKDKAKESYEKAIEADPDDEYGSKSYANRRIASMAASSGTELTDETTEATSGDDSAPATGPQALENALGSSAATAN